MPCLFFQKKGTFNINNLQTCTNNMRFIIFGTFIITPRYFLADFIVVICSMLRCGNKRAKCTKQNHLFHDINLEQFIEQDNEYMIVVMSCIYYMALLILFLIFIFSSIHMPCKTRKRLSCNAIYLWNSLLHGRCLLETSLRVLTGYSCELFVNEFHFLYVWDLDCFTFGRSLNLKSKVDNR